MMLFFHGLAIKQAYFRHQRQDALFLQPIPYTEKVSSGASVRKDVGVKSPIRTKLKSFKLMFEALFLYFLRYLVL